MHLFLFACLLLVKTFEAQDISGIATFQNKGNSNDAQSPLKGDNIYLFEQNALSEAKKLQSGIFTVIYTFLGFSNSTVGLKNVALEYSSSSFMHITSKSTIMLDSCNLLQKSPSPFLLQRGSINMVNLSLIPQKNLNPSSLIFSSDESNSAVLRNSIMANLVASSSDYFLLSGKSKSEQIKNCAFRNMSVKNNKKSDHYVEHSCFRSSMENSLIYSCLNAFEGGISSGSYSSHEFVCKNTTVSFGKRETNALEKKGQMNLTNSQSFSLCEWEDCTSSQGGALYVHDNEKAILTVENSSFVRCNASSEKGGGIYALKIAECIVTHSTFTQCAATASSDGCGGGMYLENIYYQSVVDDCSFQNCSAGNDAGAIDLRPTKTQRQKECIINSLFSSCKANHSASSAGGAIEHWSCTDQVVFSNCLFCNCHSMCGGGAAGILINSLNYGILFYYCFFHNNSCSKGGHDIALHNSTSNNIDSSCYSTRNTTNRVSSRYDSIVDKSGWLKNDFERTRFASSAQTEPNSIDTYACGRDESHPCRTISHCLTQLIPDFVKDIEILSGTITETKNVDCGINTYSIYGQSDMSTTVQTELDAAGMSLFSVSTGAFSLNFITIEHDPMQTNNRGSRLFEITGAGEMHISRMNISAGSEQTGNTAFATELINIQSGMLQMENVNWAKTISSTSLFSLSSTNEISLTLSECTFDGIERTTSGAAVMSFFNEKANIDLNSCTFEGCGSRTSADGGSMMLCVGNENEVKVNGGSFDGCFCSLSNGFGGGILLRLLNENPDFLISSSFGMNTAKWGRDIFVISPNLEEIAKLENITCVTASLDSFDKVRGFDNGNTRLAIPLCIYLLPIPEEIYVSCTEASDHSHCGIVQFPCLTLKHSLTRQAGTKKVVVNKMILVSDELAFGEQKHEIRGNDDQSGWTISDSSSISNSSMISINVETELSKLIFSLSSSFSSHSTFISSSSSTLTLSQCSLTLQDPSSEMVFLFLSIESGTLVIDSFSASSINLSDYPLISLSGSSSYTELMSIQWLNMTNCHFTEIERAAGSGGCVNIDNSNDENSNSEINIEECEFDGCSVLTDGSRGGAINTRLKGNAQLNVISCSFIRCTAPAEEGKIGFGGGMALKLIDGISSFVMSSPIFEEDEPNVARYGNDLFVESSNLTKSITNDSLPFVSENLANISLDSMRGFDGSDTTNAIPLVYFWLSLGSEVFVRGDGKDILACGFSDYPCLSIDYSLAKMPKANERNINIIGKGSLKKSVDLSGAAIKSDNSLICSLECLLSLEGAEGAAMKICGITNFELIRFVIPSSFKSGVNYLMHVRSSEGLLTLKDCSFNKNEESEEEIISFGLIKADGGTVLLEFVTIESLCFSKDVISVQPTTILSIKNLTMKNVELDGASGLCVSSSTTRENKEFEQDIVIEWSLFEEVTQSTTDDIPIIRNVNDDEPLKIVIRNTTMKKCGGLKCGKGGGMFCVLNEGGSFDCSFCTISECFCSTTGRGGWLFLECTSTTEHPLNFVLSNITFRDNSAFRGRDVYVKCHSIENQIVDEQFLLDFRAPFVKELSMWGCTTDSFVGEEDLLLRVVKYQSETVFVSSVADNHSDSKQCGESSKPCESMNVGVQHIIPSSYSQLLISEETIINGEYEAKDVSIHSLKPPFAAFVYLDSTISDNEGILISTSETVRIERLKFNFWQSFFYSGNSIIQEVSGQLSLSFVDFSSIGGSNSIQTVALDSSLLSLKSGILNVDNCSITMLSFKKPSFVLRGDQISLTNVKLKHIEATTNVFEIGNCGSVALNGMAVGEVKLSEGCIISIDKNASVTVSIGISSFKNCSRNSEGASVLSASSSSAQIVLSNCSCSDCDSLSSKGSMVEIHNAKDILMNSCQFIGLLLKESENERYNAFEEICKWNGSLVHSSKTSLVMKYVTIMNASSGGFSVSAGNVTIEKGEFMNNNPSIQKYPSLRRNIICSDSSSLTISSLKGGDGLMPNSFLWILNDRCELGGIAAERSSPFFIPKLEEASVNENGSNVVVKFKGSLFVPCDLSFRLVCKTGDVELVETHPFEEDSFISENEVIGKIPSETISTIADETEVSVMILFGKRLSATDSFALKNKTESKTGIDKAVEGGKENKSFWVLIVIIMAFVLLIIFIVAVISTLRWRKQKRRTKELEEIVNDTVRKDPKAFEMVTMEMSPEEQWRRAEREAEKKNEERIKKRVYDTNMQHSESSEHLLSESGSTEYILGRDSDKIPEWALEKVEEEEIRKQTPSPSISSTSTTDTSDTESTFVRGEDLCPTTSSMSNLVDAMACSSPHEKLIVDLRDSLFMLLHGRNKTKEMPIGSLKEREQTAAQMLFWVANLSLHSFDEMENPLSSLSNLSPHIVLFSEHMVICIVMHSDFLSDDSDSSSISSSTIVTSKSDDNDEEDSLPSSAFEDEDDYYKKECLRWKAPELLINKKMGATKESVVFSIGMILWECLTLQIPFGDYEAEVAGQKIVNGERPKHEAVNGSMSILIGQCVSAVPEQRPSLVGLKREFIQRFPAGAVIMTVSDAVDIEEESSGSKDESGSGSWSGSLFSES